jgi:hypothetical protein
MAVDPLEPMPMFAEVYSSVARNGHDDATRSDPGSTRDVGRHKDQRRHRFHCRPLALALATGWLRYLPPPMGAWRALAG